MKTSERQALLDAIRSDAFAVAATVQEATAHSLNEEQIDDLVESLETALKNARTLQTGGR